MKNNYDYWIKKWQSSATFKVEKDRLRSKSYSLAGFPKTNTYGYQDGNIRSILVADFFSRYLRAKGENVLFPTGYNSLCLSAFLENRRHSKAINDDLSEMFKVQNLRLGVGVDTHREIDMRHDEYLQELQLAFIELYEKNYIRYGVTEVYENFNKTKIYDSFYKGIVDEALEPTLQKAFYLDIKEILGEIVDKIEQLPVSAKLKSDLLSILDPKEALLIEFGTTNNKTIKILFKEPEYLGGVAFITIHPDYVDFIDYTDETEYSEVARYLSMNNDSWFGVFTGNYAINPLTGGQIPIFVSTWFDEAYHVGNPNLDDYDREVAIKEGIVFYENIQDGYFLASDFLNGHRLEEGRSMIIKNFVAGGVAEVIPYYAKERILLSSLDNFGALFPFLEDPFGRLHSLKGQLPLTFSTKYGLRITDAMSRIGTPLNGTINHIFSTGMLPLIAQIYDDIGEAISLFSPEALRSYAAWNGLEILAISEEELLEYVFFPLCISVIIERETKFKMPNLVKNIITVGKVLDCDSQQLKRSNNNLLDLDSYLDNYGGDVVRLYFLNYLIDIDFVFVAKDLDVIANFLKGIEAYYNLPFAESDNLEDEFMQLMADCKQSLAVKDVFSYAHSVLSFFKIWLWKKNAITKKHALIFLKILNPLVPFLAEDIYRSVFNGRHLLIEDGWPF